MAEAEMPKQEKATLTREVSSLTKDIRPIKKNDAEYTPAVVIKRESLGQRFKNAFTVEDARDVGDYILDEIIIPSIKKTLYDVTVGIAGRIFLNSVGVQSNNLYRENGITKVVRNRNNYSAISRQPTRAEQMTVGIPNRTRYRPTEFEFRSYDTAVQVLDDSIDYLDSYGQLSVDTYYDIIEGILKDDCPMIKRDYTAQQWGWRSLSSAAVVQSVGGWTLKMPNPVSLKG